MPDFSQGVGGAAEGAAVGAAFGGIGAPIGAGIGFIAGLFGGDSAEEERQKRKRQLLDAYMAAHRRSQQALFQAGSGLTSGARQAAAERAAAGGRTGQAESFILPAEANAENIYTNALGQEESGYEQGLLNIESDFANRPIEPTAFNYLQEAGGMLGKYKLNQDYIKAVGDAPIGGGGNLPQTDINVGDVTPTLPTEPIDFTGQNIPQTPGISLPGSQSSELGGYAAMSDLENRKKKKQLMPGY